MDYADRLQEENSASRGAGPAGPARPPERDDGAGPPGGGPSGTGKPGGAGPPGGGPSGAGKPTSARTYASVAKEGDAANKAAGGKAGGAQMRKADVEETHNVCSSEDSWQEGPWWEAVAFLADAHPQGGYKEILEEHFKRERKERDEGVARWLGIIA